ncbi:nucleotidyltransferase family protein [Paracraurococcus ruber]|uniref:nucleotidyltransferase family protein n=1 Tax=Paracraurococcus ruber TaxID=77675 RepID=UPI0030B8E6C4
MPLPIQTVYAELVEQAWLAAADRDFAGNGAFVAKTVKGRRYWYWQAADPAAPGGRSQKYVGPETPDLLARIAHHRQVRTEDRQRHSMVAALRAASLTAPDALTGRVLIALEAAGVFRLRAVVIGTVAYQVYGALLGERLGLAATRTGDLDLAQFVDVSGAVGDRIDAPDFEAVLRRADPRFRRLPGLPGQTHAEARSAYYGIGREYRVEVLTPNRDPDTDGAPVPLPALGADGHPLRYLDFLIHREVQAVALHGAGVPINVPAPERFALHKLIVARRRDDQAKARKDLAQAAQLLDVLARQRPFELAAAWHEAWSRGPGWREPLAQAHALLPGEAQVALAAALDADRRAAHATSHVTLTPLVNEATVVTGPERGADGAGHTPDDVPDP